MNAPREFSDENLTAYLDQEADAELVRDIETALAADFELAERIETLRFPMDVLADAFANQLSQAPAMPTLPPPATIVASGVTDQMTPANLPSPPKWRGFLGGVATGLAASIAAVAYFGFSQPNTQTAQPGWLEVVANYQMLYVAETVDWSRSAGATPQDNTAKLAQMSQLVGLDLTSLSDVEGLRFYRAQQLGFNGKPLIQIAYTLPDGTPVAICILPSGKDASGPKSQTLSGLASADWNTGSHGILVIGGQDQSVIDALSKQVQPLI